MIGLSEAWRRLVNSQQQIDNAETMWKSGVKVTYHRGIRRHLERVHQADPVALDAVQKFNDLLQFERWEAPSASAMKDFIDNNSLMSVELMDLLDDYSQFEITGKINRRAVFVGL